MPPDRPPTGGLDDLVAAADALCEALGDVDHYAKMAARVGQSSGTFDPFRELDRQEVNNWRQSVREAATALRELIPQDHFDA